MIIVYTKEHILKVFACSHEIARVVDPAVDPGLEPREDLLLRDWIGRCCGFGIPPESTGRCDHRCFLPCTIDYKHDTVPQATRAGVDRSLHFSRSSFFKRVVVSHLREAERGLSVMGAKIKRGFEALSEGHSNCI
jgi:hypothetical protein